MVEYVQCAMRLFPVEFFGIGLAVMAAFFASLWMYSKANRFKDRVRALTAVGSIVFSIWLAVAVWAYVQSIGASCH